MNGAAETGAQTAGHVGFQGNLAGNTVGLTEASDSCHHRLGTADKALFHLGQVWGQQVGNQAVDAQGPIVGGGFNLASELFKLSDQLVQLCSGPGAEQNSALPAGGPQLVGKEQEWRDPDAAANQADEVVSADAEPSAQRPDKAERVAGFQFGKQTGAPTDHAEEELDLVRVEPTVNGEGAAQQGIEAWTAGGHDKLTGLAACGNLWGSKGQPIKGVGQLLNGKDSGIFLELGHGRRYNRSQRV